MQYLYQALEQLVQTYISELQPANGRMWINRISVLGPPIAQQKEMKKIVRLGEDVKIQCPISGNPTPIIEWKRGGETIDYSFIRFRTKGRQLRIKKTQEDDTGVYICKGVNGFGNIEVRVDLIVIG